MAQQIQQDTLHETAISNKKSNNDNISATNNNNDYNQETYNYKTDDNINDKTDDQMISSNNFNPTLNNTSSQQASNNTSSSSVIPINKSAELTENTDQQQQQQQQQSSPMSNQEPQQTETNSQQIPTTNQQIQVPTKVNENNNDNNHLINTNTSNKGNANNRSVLILRDLDSTKIDSDQVLSLFNDSPAKPTHCEYALRNSWYVTFANDDDAKQALTFIRKYVIKWNGQPIMARYKPKPAAPSTNNYVPQMVMQQQLNVNVSTPSSSTSNTTAVNILSSSPAINAAATHGGAIMNPAEANASSGLLIYDHPHNHSILPHHHHHHHHHDGQHHHLHHHNHQTSIGGPQQHYGFSAVAYYGQHGPIITPYQNPQYDLSEVFIYNGLTPFPGVTKSSTSGQKISMGGGCAITKAALLGGGSSN